MTITTRCKLTHAIGLLLRCAGQFDNADMPEAAQMAREDVAALEAILARNAEEPAPGDIKEALP